MRVETQQGDGVDKVSMSGISLGPKTELERQVVQLKILKGIQEDAASRYAAQQERVLKLLEQAGRKSAKIGDIRVTRVQGTSTKIDSKGLAKAVGAAMWNKITLKTLDKSKLEDKIERGEIDINVVSQYTTVADNKPYIRMSAVLEGDDEDA